MAEISLLIIYAASALALIGALILSYSIMRISPDKKLLVAAQAVKEGSKAYLSRQYKTIAIFTIILAGLLYFILPEESRISNTIAFVAGSALSGLAGFLGMYAAINSNVRVSTVAEEGLDKALKIAFRGGAVTGLLVVGLALLGITFFYNIYGKIELIIGFGFGASLITLFQRVGGGIFTKSADIGADLVGKTELDLPEDDPRNPAVIADNVGDNVGDCAGMAADLFETYAVTILSSMLLGALLMNSPEAIIFPLVLGSVAIVGGIIGVFFVKLGKNENVMGALYKGSIVSAIISAIGFYFASIYILGEIKYFYISLIGLITTLSVIGLTEYYTSKRYSGVKEIVKASEGGPATNLLSGISLGFKSPGFMLLTFILAILISYLLGGLYGLGVAVSAMLSLAGTIVALDSYGPIVDNASGIIEMSKAGSKARKITEKLDAVGNTTKAVTKSYAIGSAALAALVLFASYTEELKNYAINTQFLLNDVNVLIGLFIGALIPFLFCSYLIGATGRGAYVVIDEIRRQFREIKGLREGRARPDYAKCVDIVTSASIRAMLYPALLAVLSPIILGILLGFEALGGFLIGIILSGVILAIVLAISGAAWDNAKKLVEEEGKKGTDLHKASVIGDTVGDPFKDTAGPAINPLIKVANMIAILSIPFLIKYALIILPK
jgi:K(+)-stimulated pyrophosphate-energized sodium pump